MQTYPTRLGMRTIALSALTLAACGVLLTTSSGCLVAAAAGAAAGTVAYASGDLEAELPHGPEAVVAATNAAMEELKLPVLSSHGSALEGRVEARVGTDNKATVRVKGRSSQLSHVSVRVGTFGSESMSQMILDKIKEKLAAPASAPAATPAATAVQE